MKKILLQMLRVTHFLVWFPFSLILRGPSLLKNLRKRSRE